MIVAGLAIPTGSLSQDLGGFRERIAASALDGIFRDNVDLRMLADHDPGKIMARRSAGTLTVMRERDGLHVVGTVDPVISYVGDVVRAIQRKDTTGMSFAFAPSAVSWAEEAGGPVRTIEAADFREVSVVQWAAYLSTFVTTRSAPQRALAPRRREPVMSQGYQRLELASPKPGERRDLALLELDAARRWWRQHPGRRFEMEYEPQRTAPAVTPSRPRTKMPSATTTPLRLLKAYARQIAAEETL
jgi:HK97 family phage prohead protease